MAAINRFAIYSLYQCPCCHALYKEGENEPILLPCLDTSCRTCLTVRLIGNVVQCPCCDRKVSMAHDIITTNSACFKQDSSLLRLLKFWSMYDYPDLHCDTCSEQTKQMCSNCNKLLCVTCIENHKISETSSNHILINFEDVVNLFLRKPTAGPNFKSCTVPIHESSLVDKFCTSTKKAVCSICAQVDTSDGKQHDMQDLIEVFTKSKQDIVNLSINLEEIVQKIEVKIYMTEQFRKDIRKTDMFLSRNKANGQVKEIELMKKLLKEDLKSVDILKTYVVNINNTRRAAKDLMSYKFMNEFLEELDKVKCTLEDFPKDEWLQNLLVMSHPSEDPDDPNTISIASNPEYSRNCPYFWNNPHDFKKIGKSRTKGTQRQIVQRSYSFGDSFYKIYEEVTETEVEKPCWRKLVYELNAFPKLRHLNREMQALKKSLQPLIGVFTVAVLDDLNKKLDEKIKSKSTNNVKDREEVYVKGHILLQPDSLFLLKDVQMNQEINELNIYIYGTEELMYQSIKCISPKVLPKDIRTCEELPEITSGETGISSQLYGSVEVYLCWLPPQFDLLHDNQLVRILRRLDQKTQVIYLTTIDDLMKVKWMLGRFLLDVQKYPLLPYDQLTSIRKHISDALSNQIFYRLEMLRKLLLSCKENLMLFQNSEFDGYKKFQMAVLQTALDNFEEYNILGNGNSFFDSKCSRLCEILDRKRFHVDSLLREKPKSMPKCEYRNIPEELISQLKSLKERGVAAFGIWMEEFRIYLDCSLNQEDGLQMLESDVKNIVQAHFKVINIIRCSGPLVIKYISKGDKLIPDSDRPQSYGTLGIFAKDDSGHLIGLTCGHVAHQGDTIFAVNQGNITPFGTCHQSTMGEDENVADLSLIKVYDEMCPKCSVTFLNEEGDVLKPEMYSGPASGIIKKMVYKKGATTNWTKGGISGEHIIVNERGQLLIVDTFNGEHFAKPGDSGSVVFMYDEHDVEHSKIYLLSMVAGGGVLLPEKHGALTFRLDSEVTKLTENSLKFNLS